VKRKGRLNRIASGIMLILFLASSLSLVFNIHIVKASPGTIYIRADGSIDPPTAPIATFDSVTYTFVGNITSDTDGIVVERNDIVIDGDGYTLQGSGDYYGIFLNSGEENVTIRNTQITAFAIGIALWYDCNDISISGNNITANGARGVFLQDSSNNSISGNNLTNNGGYGIELSCSSNNNISENGIINNEGGILLQFDSNHNSVTRNNIIANNMHGITLVISLGNGIFENNITNNWYGIEFVPASNNLLYHNNIINNYVQTFPTSGYANVWDDGYPSGGNYWSDYNGTDANGDGIGDTPYTIDANNKDNYPLMYPYIPGDINHDGTVDMTDAALISYYWLQTVRQHPQTWTSTKTASSTS
jgi:parallel beta-helix repeat protein